MSNREVEKVARIVAGLSRRVDGLTRARQVARSVVDGKALDDLVKDAESAQDRLDTQDELIGEIGDAADWWVPSAELTADAADEAHEAKMQALESLSDAIAALDGIENLEEELTDEIAAAQAAADAAATEANLAKLQALQNVQDILTLSSDQAVIADKARDAWNESVQAAADALAAANAVTAVQSRGNDLITNGNASQGSLNFSTFELEKGDQPIGAQGAFWVGTNNQIPKFLDENIQVDPSKSYIASMAVKQVNPGVTSRFYFGLAPYDAYGYSIQPAHYMERYGTRTELAEALEPGDTKIVLASASGWYQGGEAYYRQISFWSYVDPSGKLWEPGTYTRRLSGAGTWNEGGISGNTITLRTPWTGSTFPAGTVVGNTLSGGTYMYAPGLNNAAVTGDWTTYTQTTPFTGVHTDNTLAATTRFPAATASVRVALLSNYVVSGGTSKQLFANVSLSDVAAAQAVADSKGKTIIQPAAPAAADQLAQNLWIDTTGGANTPKRWSGSAWVAVTDKVAVDAAAAAVTAQSAADAAAAAAASAGQAATQAQTTANGKTKLFRSTAVASGQGSTVGDVWWRFGNAQFTGPVIGQWTWSGSTWVPNTIGSQVIEALTVDKLSVTGGAKIPTAVIDTLVSDQAFFNAVHSNRIVVDAADFAPGPGGYENAWVLPAAATIINDALDATGRAIRILPTAGANETRFVYGPMQRVTPGEKIVAELQVAYADGGGTVDGTWQARMIWYDATGLTISSETGIAQTTPNLNVSQVVTVPAGAVFGRVRFYVYPGGFRGRVFRNLNIKKQVGAVLIEDGAVTAPKITASSELSAKVAEFIEVKASQLVADNAAMNAAFIKQLVGEQAFFDSVLTNRLIVGGGNLIPWSAPVRIPFTNNASNGAVIGGGSDASRGGFAYSRGGTGTDGSLGIGICLTGGQTATRTDSISVAEGDTYSVRAELGLYDLGGNVPSGAAVRSARVRTAQYDAAGAYIGGTVIYGNTLTNLGYGRGQWSEARVKIVPGAKSLAVWVEKAWWSSGSLAVMTAEVMKSVGAILLEDGAVTADALRADAIDGKTITGATVRTAASGERLEFTTGGLEAFLPSGQVAGALYVGDDGFRFFGNQLTVDETLYLQGRYTGIASYSVIESRKPAVGSGGNFLTIRAKGGGAIGGGIDFDTDSISLAGDTAWANISVSGATAGYVRWRRYLGRTYLRFDLTLGTAINNGASQAVFTVPATAGRPEFITPFAVTGVGVTGYQGQISPSGVVTIGNSSGSGRTRFYGAADWEGV